MVREINQSFVSSEEILGNEVFEYRADRDKVEKNVEKKIERGDQGIHMGALKSCSGE